MITIKSQREIEIIRSASRIIKEVFENLAPLVTQGTTTKALDRCAEDIIRSRGAIPAFKHYQGYPATICASINEQVVHGIPGSRVLKNGDILSIDVGVKFQGYFSDCARTFPVGEIAAHAAQLIEVTKRSLFDGINHIKAGSRLGELSHAIQAYVEHNGFSVVRDFVGHGIGQELHEEPQIPNFGDPSKGPLLEKGMVLAIEPMVNAGSWEVRVLEDEWTVVTLDGALSAHYEDTVVVLDNATEPLT